MQNTIISEKSNQRETRIETLINELVSEWLKYSRQNSESNSEVSYTIRIIVTDVRSLEYTSAREDNIIFIYVPKHYDILPILHETGHYIGCRKRDKTRPECLLEMVTFWHIRDIYNHLFNGYMKPGVNEGAIDSSALSNLKKLVALIDDKFMEELKTNTDKEINGVLESAQGVDTRISLSTYLFCASNVVSRMLLDPNGALYKLFSDELERKCLNEMVNSYLSPDGYYTRTNYCHVEVQALVAEPTADSFALRISGLRFEKYLDRMLSWYYRSYKATSNSRGDILVKELLERWQAKEPLTRLLAVYCSSMPKENDKIAKFNKPRKSIACLFPFCSKQRFLYKFKCEFSEQTEKSCGYLEAAKPSKGQKQFLASSGRKIQAVMNPFDIIYSYINVIYNDSRYNDLCMKLLGEENEKVPDELCKIVRKIRRLV